MVWFPVKEAILSPEANKKFCLRSGLTNQIL